MEEQNETEEKTNIEGRYVFPSFNLLEKLTIVPGFVAAMGGIAMEAYSLGEYAHSLDITTGGGAAVVTGALSYIIRNFNSLASSDE